MGLIDTAIFGLTSVALLFSVIELGLSAYIVSITNRYISYSYSSTLATRCDFLVFASLWTLLVMTFLILLPMMSARRSGVSKSGNWVTPVTLALNILTMLFWLGGFAALADLFAGHAVGNIIGATLAFAVMLWLITLALMIINILTALAVVHCDRLGYSPMNGKRTLP